MNPRAPSPADIAFSQGMFSLANLIKKMLPGAPMEARASFGMARILEAVIIGANPPKLMGMQTQPQVEASTIADIFAGSIIGMIAQGASGEEQAQFINRLNVQLLQGLASDPAHPLHESYLKTLPPKEDVNDNKPLN